MATDADRDFMRRAIAMKAQPAVWAGMVQTAMVQELSWDGPARQYAQLYERLRAGRSSGGRHRDIRHSIIRR